MSDLISGEALPRLLAGLLLSATLAMPVVADDAYVDFLKREHGTLGKSTAGQMLDLVGSVDPTSGDMAETAQAFSILAPIDPRTGAVTGRPTVDGVISMTISTRPDRPFYGIARLLFDSVAERNKFVAGLETVLGAPDSACSSETIVHFSPAPSHTVTFRMPEPDGLEAEIEISGSDPVDANCARSASPKDFLVNEADLAAYLERLRDAPPPLGDLADIEAWLAPYGKPERKNEGSCDIDLILPSWDADPRPALAGLEGFHYIDASAAPCAGNNPKVNYVAINAHNGADMFGMDKAVAVATETYGAPTDDCGEPYLYTWELDGKRTVMITEVNRAFAVVHYDALLAEYDC